MTDAAILRDVYGRNAAKKIARQFDVAVVTAKLWLAGRFPEYRTQQLADAIRAEIGRIDARNAEILQQLDAADAAQGGHETRPVAGAVVQRAVGDGEAAGRLGRGVKRG